MEKQIEAKKWSALTAILGIIVCFAFVSCGKNDGSGEGLLHSSKTLSISDSQRQQIARDFAAGVLDCPNALIQLNNAIDVVRSYGVGEKVFVRDIMNPEHSKFLPASQPLNDLRQVIIASNMLQVCGVSSSDTNYGNLQIYWPYHDIWNNTVMPTIVFAPENLTATTVWGVRLTQGHTLQDVNLTVGRLDIDYVTNTYIVIKQGEFPYDYYPNFRDGIDTNENGRWIIPSSVTGQDGEVCFLNNITGQDTLLEATVLTFQSGGTFHDGWLQDDNEFSFTFIRVNADGTTTTSSYNFEMTRKQINDHERYSLNAIFAPKWRRECNEIYYRAVEKDAWGWNVSATIALNYQDVSVTATIQKNNSDDVLSEGILDRDNYIDKCLSGNNKWSLGQDSMSCKSRLYSSSPF